MYGREEAMKTCIACGEDKPATRGKDTGFMWKKECKIDGCDDPVRARGWCNKHWTRWWKYGDPLVIFKRHISGRACKEIGCDEPHYARGWCSPHYSRWKKTGSVLDGWGLSILDENKRERSRRARRRVRV
jgi:hypothetical protein